MKNYITCFNFQVLVVSFQATCQCVFKHFFFFCTLMLPILYRSLLQGNEISGITLLILEDCSHSIILLSVTLSFIGRTDATAETPIFWPPHAKSWFIGKDSDAGRDGGRRRRGWQRMRWLDGITDSMDMSLKWTPGVGDGQGGLACCDSWGRKGSDTTEQLNWTDSILVLNTKRNLQKIKALMYLLFHFQEKAVLDPYLKYLFRLELET